ncbi:MAG: type IV pilus modification PilV family protein [Thermoguttaceae bacterium]
MQLVGFLGVGCARGKPGRYAVRSHVRIPSRATRRGVSLLEILIAIGILLFGLLGVAALLEAGRTEIGVAARADRASACARAAMRELIVRQMIQNTRYADGSSGLPAVPVAIDPVGVARNGFGPFPASGTITMRRVSLCSDSNRNLPMPLAVASRVFTGWDQLVFDMPDDRTQRPRQLFRTKDGVTSDVSKLGAVEMPEAEGNYSWMATVVPSRSELGTNPKMYTVSVAVFYQRPPDAASELTCGIQFFSGGVQFGSGDAWLYVPAGLPDPERTAVRERLMELRRGEWVLLRGEMGTTPPIQDFKWYRMAALGDFEPGSGTFAEGAPACDGRRLVTLAGPDWLPIGNTEVGLLPRVVGVYTQTVEVQIGQ